KLQFAVAITQTLRTATMKRAFGRNGVSGNWREANGRVADSWKYRCPVPGPRSPQVIGLPMHGAAAPRRHHHRPNDAAAVVSHRWIATGPPPPRRQAGRSLTPYAATRELDHRPRRPDDGRPRSESGPVRPRQWRHRHGARH